MTNIEKVNHFINEAGVFFFLTTDGDQPKGRPMNFHVLLNDKLYFGTGTFKSVYRQLTKNPHVEILALNKNKFMRYNGTIKLAQNPELEEKFKEQSPAAAKVYEEKHLGMEYYELVNAHAEFRTSAGLIEEFDL